MRGGKSLEKSRLKIPKRFELKQDDIKQLDETITGKLINIAVYMGS